MCRPLAHSHANESGHSDASDDSCVHFASVSRLTPPLPPLSLCSGRCCLPPLKRRAITHFVPLAWRPIYAQSGSSFAGCSVSLRRATPPTMDAIRTMYQPLEKRDGGFNPSVAAFPRQSIHCYRAIVALPFIIVVLLTTSVPFLVLSIVYWDDGCWSGNAWWYRPTTVCAVSNVLALCIAPLVVFVFARPDDGSGSARSALAFIGISIILVRTACVLAYLLSALTLCSGRLRRWRLHRSSQRPFFPTGAMRRGLPLRTSVRRAC